MSDNSPSREDRMDEDSPAPSDDDEGVDLRPGAPGHDSSEEDATDSEEEREVRKGFIVDEDDSRKKRRRKKKRSKRDAGEGGEEDGEGEGGSRKRRERSEDAEDLDEDDLELLQENLGFGRPKSSKNKLKRLRRRRASASGSEGGSPRDTGDLRDIFADEESAPRRRAGGAGDIEGLFDPDEMAGFIEDDSDESRSERGSDSEDEDDRRRRKDRKKREKKEQARKRRGLGMGRVEGITSEAWGEVAEVFGNGTDYAWAMELSDGEEEKGKELKDIFEPSEIASRMLTEEDEKIRTTDVPERMQLASSGLPSFALSDEGELQPLIPQSELRPAALWMSDKLTRDTVGKFTLRDDMGNPAHLHSEYLAAVEAVVRFVNVEFLEPPHIWAHRADYLFYAPPGEHPQPLLQEDDLWRVAALSVKYRAFLVKRDELLAIWRSLGAEDVEADDVIEQLQTGEEVSDALSWISLRWGDKVRDLKRMKGEQGEGEDGEPVEKDAPKRPKRALAGRDNAYENAKKSVVSKLAELIAISPTSLAIDVASQTKTHTLDDPEKTPDQLADDFAGSQEYATATDALNAAKLILRHEIAAEPLLRKEVRRFYREFAVVNVEATRTGETKIDQMNPFYAFKYLREKPLREFVRSPQWLQILAAEADGLVTTSIVLQPASYDRLFGTFRQAYLSDYTSALAEEWNDLRAEVLKGALEEMQPEGESFTRGWLKEEAEDYVSTMCRRKLESRINAAPWCRGDGTMEAGQTPSVLALSNGNGDPRRDSIIAVFLDSDGHFREHLTVDRLDGEMDPAQRDALTELLKRRRPQVCVVGGFRPATVMLMEEFRRFAGGVSEQILEAGDANDDDEDEDNSIPYEEKQARKRNRAAFESSFVYDDVARIYQNSARAAQEFTELSTLGKYCIGLARYIQSPLNEYAALGTDLGALTYDPNQKFLAKEKVAQALERALIEVTNKVGVDINKAVRNSYYAHLLPYVAGLGPRKADAVIKKINATGGTLATRSGLVIHQIMSKNIWVNASGFLRIRQDDLAADLGRDTENEEDPDVLDDTRIHPEDYDVARKMAADAMEYDEEDLEGASASKAVEDLFGDDVNKLNELALDEFADELSKVLQQPKRLTLYNIRSELQHPFAEKRQPFEPPNPMELFTMFTGETTATLDQGLIIPVRVLRVSPDETVIVRLDCGIEGFVPPEFRTDGGALAKLRPGQTLQAVVMDVRYKEMKVDLTTQERLVDAGDAQRRFVPPDFYFDAERAAQAQKAASRQQQKATGRIKRQIPHPNFQDISSGKAEEFLSSMQRGDCVVRPSSKEDHIAVTWKVDDGIYQHIAVHELDKPNEYSLGAQLRISDRHRYTDLDELIDAHIKQMARKVNEMTNSDKFKGKRDSLDKFLQNWTLANPGRSIYAFGWDDDRRKPGQILLGFRTNEKAPINYWNVTVVPEGYVLKGSVHGDVQSLINAFKTAYAYSTQDARGAPPPGMAGGRTPAPGYGMQTGRTPAYQGGRTPGYPNAGGRTPAVHAGGPPQSGYPQAAYGAGPQPGRTPNPYGPQNPSGRTPNPYGQQNPYGRTPNPHSGGYNAPPPGVQAAQQAQGAYGGATPGGGYGYGR
ncbi:hypothetical protein JCM10213_002156 [Rhodosporidiobolus nylandii]